MDIRRSGVAVLVGAGLLLAASPAFAVIATCTARDSDGHVYMNKQTGVFDWQVKTLAERFAGFDCRSRSKHPQSCKIVSCTVMP